MAAMSRGQFIVKMITRLGIDVNPEATSGFSDAGYLDAYLAAAVEAGLITEASAFNPSAPITREQVATIMDRYYDFPTGSATFSDVEADRFYTDAIGGAEAAGVFKGYGDGRFGVGDSFDDRWFDKVFNDADRWAADPENNDPIEGTTGTDDIDSTPSVSGGGTGSDASNAVTAARQNEIDSTIQFIETQYGLSGPDVDQFVNDLMREPTINADVVYSKLRELDSWKTRFAAIIRREELGLDPMSVDDVLAYEHTVRNMMKQVGFPPGFYDSTEDFVDLLAADRDAISLMEDITDAFERIAYAPDEIKQAYASMFGVSGTEALAAFLLDPEKAQPVLEREVTSAEITGAGTKFGTTIGMEKAMELADLGIDRTMAYQGFSRIASLDPVFKESFAEEFASDLTAEETGVGATFEGDAMDAREIDRRIQTRLNAFRGGGGAVTNQGGVLGLSTA